MVVVCSKQIRFLDFNRAWIVIPKGSRFFLDVKQSIGYLEGQYFDVNKEEYSVIN